MAYPDAPSLADSILRQATAQATEPVKPAETATSVADAVDQVTETKPKGPDQDPLMSALSGLLQGGQADKAPQANQVSQLQERLSQAEQRALALEVIAAQNYINQYKDGTPERAKAQAEADVWAAQRMANLQITQERSARESLEAGLLPIIQDLIFSDVSVKQGIPKDVLKKYAKTPQQLAALVEGWTELKKADNFRKRSETKIDQTTTSGSPEAPGRSSVEEVRKQFRGTGNIQGYLKELRKAAR